MTPSARALRLAIGVLALLTLCGPAGSGPLRRGPIRAADAWARPTTAGADISAGYLKLVNTTDRSDRLLSAASPRVAQVAVQETTMAGSVMRMREVAGGLEIGPHRTLTLAPGGYHLMLIGLKRPLKPGDHLPMTLQFEKAGQVKLDLVVRAPLASGMD